MGKWILAWQNEFSWRFRLIDKNRRETESSDKSVTYPSVKKMHFSKMLLLGLFTTADAFQAGKISVLVLLAV